MKKKYIIFICMLFSLLIFPFVIGWALQKNFEKMLATFEKEIHTPLKIITYRRGWFSSDVVLAVNFPLADRPMDLNHAGMVNALEVRQHIQHGPIILKPQAPHIVFTLATINSYLDSQVVASTVINFTTSLNTRIKLADFIFRQNNKEIYHLKNVSGNLVLNAAHNHLVTHITLQQLTSNFDSRREINDFSTHQDLRKIGNLWVGRADYFFKKLQWHQGDRKYIFNQLAFASNSCVEKTGMQASVDSKVQSITSGKMDYGKQAVSIKIKNLNENEMELLHKEAGAVLAQTASPWEISQFHQQIFHLLQKGIELEIKQFNLKTAWGDVHIRAFFSCPCQSKRETLLSWLSSSNAIINGQLPITVANNLLSDYFLLTFDHVDLPLARQKAAALIEYWRKAGWLTITENNLLIDFNSKSIQKMK